MDWSEEQWIHALQYGLTHAEQFGQATGRRRMTGSGALRSGSGVMMAPKGIPVLLAECFSFNTCRSNASMLSHAPLQLHGSLS